MDPYLLLPRHESLPPRLALVGSGPRHPPRARVLSVTLAAMTTCSRPDNRTHDRGPDPAPVDRLSADGQLGLGV